jgi:hypothetical protein
MSISPRVMWDCREPGWFDPEDRWRARTRWLEDRGLTGLSLYRIEFRLIDGPSARLYRYALDGHGKRHWNEHHPVPAVPHDHSRCAPAVLEPYDVMLAGLPPEELW